MKNTLQRSAVLLLLSALIYQPSSAHAQGTAFTYQGRLNNTNGPANGSYDLQFAIYDAAGGGTKQGVGFLTNSPTAVSNGLFTVTLDFGSGVFPGAGRWLEIAVRTNGGGAFTILAPRQALTPSPYAITAGNMSGVLSNSSLPANAVFPGAVAAVSFSGNGVGVTNVDASKLGGLAVGNFWQLNGNNVGAGQFLGSTNNQPVELRVNNQRGLRLETGGSVSVNVIGGYAANYIAPGVAGSTIGGGGAGNSYASVVSNSVLADFAVIGGGSRNTIQTYAGNSTIGGGAVNTLQTYAYDSTIGGGYGNTIQTYAYDSTIGGGLLNVIQTNAIYSTIGGGTENSIQTGTYYSTIGGGAQNVIQSNVVASTIGGGYQNVIQSNVVISTIGGGNQNTIQPNSVHSTIAGGNQNTIEASNTTAVIGGGTLNRVQAGSGSATIGGGNANRIEGNVFLGTVAGGGGNWVQTGSDHGSIGGGSGNLISPGAVDATIAGGVINTVGTGARGAAIGGGENNYALTNYAVVSGGSNNVAAAISSTIGGGSSNVVQALAEAATIAGGSANAIQFIAIGAVIGGGSGNFVQTNSSYSTIAGGRQNVIQSLSQDCTIGGGSGNAISLFTFESTIGGGSGNFIRLNADNSTIGGGLWNTNTGASATIPGGVWNVATNSAFAAGSRAKAIHTGAFVWGDSQDADFSSTATNQFLVRASGGVGINTSNPAVSLTVQGKGAYNAIGAAAIAVKNSAANKTWEWHVLDDGRMQFADLTAAATRMLIDTNGNVGIGAITTSNKLEVAGSVGATVFNTTSDRSAKENFAAVSASEILAKVAALPITRWNFKQETGTPHIGPMAQDFHAAFGTGTDDRHIATVDADGVALAAIQGLNEKVEQKEAEITELKARLEKLERLLNPKNEEAK